MVASSVQVETQCRVVNSFLANGFLGPGCDPAMKHLDVSSTI